MRLSRAVAVKGVYALAVRGAACDQPLAVDALHREESREAERVGETDDRRGRHAGAARDLGDGGQRHLVGVVEREARDALQAVGQRRIGLGDRAREVVVAGDGGHGS